MKVQKAIKLINKQIKANKIKKPRPLILSQQMIDELNRKGIIINGY